MEANGWDVLGDTKDTYSAGRLSQPSGNPLRLHKSRIDYSIVTRGSHGLGGEEVTATQATIHTGRVGDDPEAHPYNMSDHLPVTVKDEIMGDTDQPIPNG